MVNKKIYVCGYIALAVMSLEPKYCLKEVLNNTAHVDDGIASVTRISPVQKEVEERQP